ncbi:MAG: hypothetical protein NTW79_03585 [Candidatus Berkelbacteria bacterium]|nr:hypothetical protein [Candidatus Berkelbacteria bacterium]
MMHVVNGKIYDNEILLADDTTITLRSILESVDIFYDQQVSISFENGKVIIQTAESSAAAELAAKKAKTDAIIREMFTPNRRLNLVDLVGREVTLEIHGEKPLTGTLANIGELLDSLGFDINSETEFGSNLSQRFYLDDVFDSDDTFLYFADGS